MPSRNDPCPCGSGKKYKKCCAVTKGALVQQPLAKRNITVRTGPVAQKVISVLTSVPAQTCSDDACHHKKWSQPGKQEGYSTIEELLEHEER